MRIDILTLFPNSFSALEQSIVARAQGKQIVSINITNIRDFALDKHQSVDDTPYGGGAGMVMRVDTLHMALKTVIGTSNSNLKPYVILLSSAGFKYDQKEALALSKKEWLILVCGHYEGVDERFLKYVDQEVSIGDYVLSGGEIPASVIVDSVVRLLPGSIEAQSLSEESFNNGEVEYPHYTRPPQYDGESVPPVLLSGDHAAIKEWRKSQSKQKTANNRADLLKN